jgi:mRNA interferase MazF
MTAYKPGDVILVQFIFSDESGVKKRPGLVISSGVYNSNRNELVIAAITGQVEKKRCGDCLINSYREAGLIKPSIVTGVYRTIRSRMVDRVLGELSPSDLKAVYQQVIANLCLQDIR